MMGRFVVVLGLLSVGGLCSACADGSPCDPDQELVRNSCVPKASQAAGGAGGESGDGDAGDGSGDADNRPEPDEFFGLDCTDDDTVCGGDAPFCAVSPFDGSGTCSVEGCNTDPENVICPQGWECLAIADVCYEP